MRHTEIALQDVTNSRYQLELFVGNQKIELEKKGDRTWMPMDLVVPTALLQEASLLRFYQEAARLPLPLRLPSRMDLQLFPVDALAYTHEARQ